MCLPCILGAPFRARIAKYRSRVTLNDKAARGKGESRPPPRLPDRELPFRAARAKLGRVTGAALRKGRDPVPPVPATSWIKGVIHKTIREVRDG
jgi:hypothetical protein